MAYLMSILSSKLLNHDSWTLKMLETLSIDNYAL